jgi:hypothetical protein
MKKWVQKKMRNERAGRKPFMIAVIMMLLGFGCIGVFMYLLPFIEGLAVLDSGQKLSRFTETTNPNAALKYESARNTGKSVTITTSKSDQYNLIIGGMFVQTAPTYTSTDKHYQVWQLKGADYTALYCSTIPFEDIGQVYVRSNDVKLAQDIIEYLGYSNENVYVVYNSITGGKLPIWAFVCIGLALLLLWPSFGNMSIKRTKLATQICSYGDFKTIVDDINYQHMTPLFESRSLVLLKDWALIRIWQGSNVFTDLCSVGEIQSIALVPDPDDEDEVLCTLQTANHAPYTFYMTAAEANEMTQIKSRMRLEE